MCSGHVWLPPYHTPSRSFPPRLRHGKGTTYALQRMTIVQPPLATLCYGQGAVSAATCVPFRFLHVSQRSATLCHFYIALDGRVCHRTLFATGRRAPQLIAEQADTSYLRISSFHCILSITYCPNACLLCDDSQRCQQNEYRRYRRCRSGLGCGPAHNIRPSRLGVGSEQFPNPLSAKSALSTATDILLFIDS